MTINLLLRDLPVAVRAYARVSRPQQRDRLEAQHTLGSILQFRLLQKRHRQLQLGGPAFLVAQSPIPFRRPIPPRAGEATTFPTSTNSLHHRWASLGRVCRGGTYPKVANVTVGRPPVPIRSPIGPWPPPLFRRRRSNHLHRWASLGPINRGGMNV